MGILLMAVMSIPLVGKNGSRTIATTGITAITAITALATVTVTVTVTVGRPHTNPPLAAASGRVRGTFRAPPI
jgi:hypothetical protein